MAWPDTDVSLLDVPSARSDYREVNDVRLHVVTAGPEDGPLVVLLHGFPEFWYCWRRYVEPLASAGYRVLVPDQRGYNLSDSPDDVGSYAIEALTGDVTGLVASEGRESTHVVGHDLGASVGWELALRHPGLVDTLGVVNVPHPAVFRRTLRSNPRQLLRSWYVLYFQLPRLPEWCASRDDFALLVAAMRDTAEPRTFDAEDFERYRAAWRQPGGLTGMLHWYRAFARNFSSPDREVVDPPTLVVWGEEDHALVPRMAPESVDLCEDGRLERFPEATHWVHHERPGEVVELLLEHLERRP